MLFGHNTNLKHGDLTLHVQTEDRGEAHALIDTTVYFRGRVLHRRTNGYLDLLLMNEGRAEALRLRVGEQHRSVIEEIRTGALHLTIPKDAAEPASGTQPTFLESPRLAVELMNVKSWLSGKRARLQLAVKDRDGRAVSGAKIKVEIEGSENGRGQLGQTGNLGQAEIEFDMPRITGADAAMVIEVEHETAKGHLRFALRAKPRVPSV